MKKIENGTWVPTPTFLYRNYIYKGLVKDLPKKNYFLEIGTGNGEFLKHLADLGLKGESIDFSESVISRLKSQKVEFGGVVIKKGNILKYETDKRYDAVFCFEVLEHIKEDNLAIRNISKLLKPNGKFFFSVPAHQREWSIIDVTKGHFRRYEREDIERKLKDNGLKSIKILNYGFPFLNIIRNITKRGILIKLQKMSLKKKARTGLSSLQQEYNPKLKIIVANKLLLMPLFKIMDLFLNYDLGFGYIVVAKKK